MGYVGVVEDLASSHCSPGSLPSGKTVRVLPQGSHSPASHHAASLPQCLPEDGGCASIPLSNKGRRINRRQLSGISIGDSSIRNRNRVLLLQQELTAEGVWEVGKWLGAAYAGDEAEVLAHIRALDDRDKVRGEKQ
ncbi:hypothetical protein Ancab_015180 [Ancistrocladus abbreviatus]